MTHNILLIGGHGKVSQLLTPLLLARSWNVTSLIRSADQKPTIEKLGQGQAGKLNVLVSSVENIQSEDDAKGILDQVKPDWVVWSAGKCLGAIWVQCFQNSFIHFSTFVSRKLKVDGRRRWGTRWSFANNGYRPRCSNCLHES